MRSILALVLLLASGCAPVVETSPNTFKLDARAAAHLRGSQTVRLENAQRVGVDNRGLGLDEHQMTDTAMEMLRQSLEGNSIAVGAAGEKRIQLRVRIAGTRAQLAYGVPIFNGVIFLDARFGDATATSIKSENRSPGGWQRTFDGALLFAVQALLEDPEFVSYMNRPAPAPAVVSTTACGATSPATWTNCVGTYAVPDGSKYVGEFKDGKYGGQGELTLSNGVKYVGEFKDGRYHGQGVATRPDGSVIHSGVWANGKPFR